LETDALPIELLTYFSNLKLETQNLEVTSELTFQFVDSSFKFLFGLLVLRVLPAEAAVLRERDPFRRLLLVLRRAVVATLAVAAGQMNDVSHNSSL
jgi:hypothetical protein